LSGRARRALLVQLPVPGFRWPHLDANIPLAAGYLAAAAKGRAPGWDVEVLPWQEADLLGDEALLGTLASRRPDLVGFTTYSWNAERTAHFVGRLQEAGIPSIIGGPEVTADNPWLSAEAGSPPAVACEGEVAFPTLLRTYPDLPKGVVVGRAPDLAKVPSPYLTGVLAPAPDGSVWLETLRGCPFRCDYCTYGKRRARVRRFPGPWLAEHLDWARARGAREVYLMDPSFNVRPDWEAVLQTLEQGNRGGALAFHTELVAERLRPGDATRLAAAGLRSCEVGLQSADARVLAAVGRPWRREDWVRGVRELLGAGVAVSVGLIVGLPGDTLEGFTRSLEFVLVEAPGADIQVFPLALLPGSRLRERAPELGLAAQTRPPYAVLRTPDMGPEELVAAFRRFEERTGLELDPVPAPRLTGPWTGGDHAPYLSGVRLELAGSGAAPEWVERVAPRAANDLTLWIRGWHEEFPEQFGRFCQRLPHAVLTVVVEDCSGWEPARLDRLLQSARFDEHYLDRQARLLVGGPVLPRLVTLLDASQKTPEAWLASVRSRADVVWTVAVRTGWAEATSALAQAGETVFVNGPVPARDLEALAGRLGAEAAGLCFSDPGAQNAWHDLLGLPSFRVPDHRIHLP